MRLYKYKKIKNPEIEQECKKTFTENYVKDSENNTIRLATNKGERVVFNENDFDHAFSYSEKGTGVEKFSYQRARRVLWIKEVVTGNTTCVRKDIGKDVYFYYNDTHNYLIYLKKLSRGGLRFVTHYVAKSKKTIAHILDVY
jgi:hypothetical protein